MLHTGKKIFVCSLNIQEGRNPSYLSRLTSLCSPYLVKTFTDPVLNRTNLTVVGGAGEIEGVVGGLAEFISTTPSSQNTGNHGNTPGNHGNNFKDHHHIGMMDLIPIHPVSKAATLSEAGTIARNIASHLDSLSIPTLLYGAADPQNRSLVQVRKSTKFFSSQYDQDNNGLGVSVIGATPYVLSFNMALNTANMEIAKGMLPLVRSKSVQAMAYLNTHPEHGTVSEVSCNLTDPSSVEGSPERVLERVRVLARERGIEVCHWYSTNPPFEELMDLYQNNVGK
eukprot:sb/3467856/